MMNPEAPRAASTARPDAVAYVLAAALALAPVLSFFEPRWVTPLVVTAAVAGLAILLARKQRLRLLGGWAGRLVVLFCLWAAVSAAWSLDAGLAFKGAFKLSGSMLTGSVILAMALSLKGEGIRFAGFAALAGFTVTLAMWAAEILFDGPITVGLIGFPLPESSGFFWLNSTGAILTILAWPVSAFLVRRKKTPVAVFLFAAVFVTAYLHEYNSGMIALIFGALAFALAWFVPRCWFAGPMAAVLAGGILLAPLVPLKVLDPVAFARNPSVPQAAVHRLHIWRFTAGRIMEKPVLGWGMNASRVIPRRKEQARDDVRGTYGQLMPLHPHNFALQVWLETGAPGAVLVALFAVVLLRRIGGANSGRPGTALFAGQFFTGVGILAFGFGVWQSWALASLWLNASLMAALFLERESGPGQGEEA
jgi:O-antigen ligase